MDTKSVESRWIIALSFPTLRNLEKFSAADFHWLLLERFSLNIVIGASKVGIPLKTRELGDMPP